MERQFWAPSLNRGAGEEGAEQMRMPDRFRLAEHGDGFMRSFLGKEGRAEKAKVEAVPRTWNAFPSNLHPLGSMTPVKV